MTNEQNNGVDNVKTNSEPTELDPCMEDSKAKRNPNAFLAYRDKMCERSGLSKKGVYIVGTVIIVSVLLLIVVIALASAWPRIPHEYQYPICTKPECLRAAAQVSLVLFY